jgi:peptide/nickel transport system ATP-binding protein
MASSISTQASALVAAPLLRVQNLQVSFSAAEKPALVGVSLDLFPGQITAVVGESGSGKTLTALALMGLLPPQATVQGQLLWQPPGQAQPMDLCQCSPSQRHALRGSQMAMVFQEPMTSLNPLRRIGSQLREQLRALRLPQTEQWARVHQALAEVQLPDPPRLAKAYPHQLSGGQLQRVMLAMALLLRPALLVADEPTTALDSLVQQDLLLLFRDLAAKHHIAVLFISHDLHLTRQLAHHTVVMYKGQVVEQAPTASMFDRPQHPYTHALLHCRPSIAHKGYLLPTVADLLNSTAPDTPAPIPLAQHTPEAAPVLQVEGLHKTYRSAGRTVPALRGIRFDLMPSEILGVVGASGCGKSTLARILLGQETADAGQVQLLGAALPTMRPRLRAQVVQLVFQDPYSSLNPRLTVGSAIAEPLWVHGKYPTYKACRVAAQALLQAVGLPADAYDRYPHQFSGGQRQRLVIARALALGPQVLVCDEAVAALDVSVQAQVLNLLLQLRASHGLSLLFISHDLAVVHYLCDRILVLEAGQVAELAKAQALVNHPQSAIAQRFVQASGLQ